MAKKIIALLSVALLVTLLVVPVHAAPPKKLNLIDSKGMIWNSAEAGGADATYSFEGNSLVATATGGWPYVYGTLKTPVVYKESDNAVLKIKFKVQDESTATSIRIFMGEDSSSPDEYIFVHHFVKNGVYDNAGDLLAGEYELNIKLFDLKAYNGSAENVYLGTKDLFLTEKGELIIDGIQVWCSGGSSNKMITVEQFEITTGTAPPEPVDSEDVEDSDTSEPADDSDDPDAPIGSEDSVEPDDTDDSVDEDDSRDIAQETDSSEDKSEAVSETKSKASDEGGLGTLEIIIIAIGVAVIIGAIVFFSKKKK